MTLEILEPPDYYDEDNELGEDCCPRCGAVMRRRDCDACGGEGYYEPYDDDPLWYDPGDVFRCEECGGRGYFTWCAARCADEPN